MATIPTTRHFPRELAGVQQEIEGWARDYGLDFYEVIFEILEYDELCEVAAYGGFPSRYPHWRFGMEHEELMKRYSYGLQKIYEMVINNDPSYAYLLRCNAMVDQKLVMAHVYGHVDFFKNNIWFSHTNRKMMDEIANHGSRVRTYIAKHGLEKVEEFLDYCLSIEDLIDIHSSAIKRRQDETRSALNQDDASEGDRTVVRLRAKSYMDPYINPPGVLEVEKRRIQEEKEKPKKLPEEPQRDVLLFLLEHAPLESWQSDVLAIIREEAYYFAPQAQTKIMNEGWASYWHSKIMTRRGLNPSELVDYADHHSGTMGAQPGRINPYKLGIELFRDVEDRWNKGRFGPEYEHCDDLRAKANWDKQVGLGQEKIFEVRKIYNDITFIDTFLTPEFCREHKLFSYSYSDASEQYEIESREFAKIKERLLFNLTNFGRPIIYVDDGNHRNRGELYLRHDHIGVDLRLDHARDTLRNLQRIWSRPVHLETSVDGKQTILSFDGSEHSTDQV